MLFYLYWSAFHLVHLIGELHHSAQWLYCPVNSKWWKNLFIKIKRLMFHKPDTENISNMLLVIQMIKWTCCIPFNAEEIQKAVKCFKQWESPGIDNFKGEMIKCGQIEIHKWIADIFNEIAEMGTFPDEIKEGILILLPKLGEKPGPPGHLRPFIILSVLRNILAICMIRWSMEKINKKIPASQVAYRQRRSATEQVFSFKVLAEKAITLRTTKSHCYF